MAELVLGPMLRHVTDTSATVWVETDGPCRVEVAGSSAATFCVEGHHYALAIVKGLAPGSVTPYDVRLDGELRWPLPDSWLPPSSIRTIGDGRPLHVLFGSCRTAAPHEPPWSLELADDDRGRGVDALRAHALRMLGQPVEEWPDMAALLGDQVYADDSSPETRQRIRARRAGRPSQDAPAPELPPDDLPPADLVADFEEYTWLYHESWRPEVERWFFSVVPTTMIFDDHDMIDDWNISASWVAETRELPWWEDHIVGGLVSYWIYQHLGNLSPDQIEAEGMLAELQSLPDGGPILREWARRSEAYTPSPGGYRFSYVRDLGATRLVVLDVRNGRVLEPGGRRLMIDQDDVAWLAEQCQAEVDHLLIATSLPVFVTGALHDIQVWNEAVCAGAWGKRAARYGEKLRRSIDLEDWPAFSESFDALVDLLAVVGAKGGPHPPASITLLSGDIHFSYLAKVSFPDHDGEQVAVHQVVSSPIRNALTPKEKRVIRAALSRPGRMLAGALRRATRRPPSPGVWELTEGPVFANVMGQVTIDGRNAEVTVEQATPTDDGEPELHVVLRATLSSSEPAGTAGAAGTG